MSKSHHVHLDSKRGSEANGGSEFAGLHRRKSFGPTELVHSWTAGRRVAFASAASFPPAVWKFDYTAVLLAGAVPLLATQSVLGWACTDSTDWELCLACCGTSFSHGEATSVSLLSSLHALQPFSQAWPIDTPRIFTSARASVMERTCSQLNWDQKNPPLGLKPVNL